MPPVDPMQFLTDLSRFPHRGVGTPEAGQAADFIAEQLEALGASLERQHFKTPTTYIIPVLWMIGSLVGGLVLQFWLPWLGFVLALFGAVSALLFFDWRPSPAIMLPPRKQATNIIGRFGAKGEASRRLILMAHYDTAPVSFLYKPGMVEGFAQSLRQSLALTVLAVIVALLAALGFHPFLLVILRMALAVYFVGQIILSALDYLRYGFTNGASDNGSGVAAAIAAASRVQADLPPDWCMEVVLTSAEEIAMVGAAAYFLAEKDSLGSQTYVLNLDTVGNGDLKMMIRTGSLTPIVYDNPLVDAAKALAGEDIRFASVATGEWHTGDFDTARYARAGIPCLTLGALDENKQMPNLHRLSDTLENLVPETLELTTDFTEALARRLMGIG